LKTRPSSRHFNKDLSPPKKPSGSRASTSNLSSPPVEVGAAARSAAVNPDAVASDFAHIATALRTFHPVRALKLLRLGLPLGIEFAGPFLDEFLVLF